MPLVSSNFRSLDPNGRAFRRAKKQRVYGPGQPYFPPPHRPPPPKPGLSPLVIVLIVLGGVLVLGGGACVVLGALVAIGASAEADPAATSSTSTSTSTTSAPPAVAPPGATTAAPAVADDEPESDPDSDPSSDSQGAPSPTATAKPAGNAANGATWFCSASGSARVCGFAGACNYQMMFGNGFGKDRFLASQQAKNACEAQARAKGTSTVCVVQCSLR